MSTTPEDPFARPSDGADAQQPVGEPQAWSEPLPHAPQDPAQYAQPQYAQPEYAQPQYAQPQYAQPGYAPSQYQQGYPPVYGGPNPRQAKNWMGIVSLVASVSTIFTLVGCIVGIVFGHLGLGAVKRGEADNRGLALAGLITGYVFLGIGLLIFIAYALFFVAIVGATTY